MIHVRTLPPPASGRGVGGWGRWAALFLLGFVSIANAAAPASPIPSLPVVKLTPTPAVLTPLAIPKATATVKKAVVVAKKKPKVTPTPVPLRTPDPRVKQGKAKDGFAWKVRPWRIPVGVWPKAIRFSPDGATAITTNFDSQTISVIDVATQEVRETLDMRDRVTEAEWSVDGSKVYVSGWLHDGFYEIDVGAASRGGPLASLAAEGAGWKVRRVKVGDKPKGVAVSPDGSTAYAVNWAGDTISVVDLASHAVTATIPVGGVPRWIALTRDGKTGLVTNFRGKSLSVLDLEKNVETKKIYGIQNPRHIVMNADDSIAYVTDREGGKLHAVGVAKKKVLWSVRVGNRPKTVDLSNDGLYAFTANYGSNDMTVVRLKDHKVVATVPAGASPSGLEVAPDGKSVWISNWYDYDVTIVDVAWPKGAQETLPAIGTAPPGSRPLFPKGSVAKTLVADPTPAKVLVPEISEGAPMVVTSASTAARATSP